MTTTSPKPGQWSAKYAQIFKDQSVVDAYHLRPAYATETFLILAELRARRIDASQPRFFTQPTPGTPNLGGVVQFLPPPRASHPRGFRH